MIRNLDSIVEDQLPLYDVCIIGTGPAGVTLGVELADTSLRVCLLESGGLTKSRQGDGLRRVVSEGICIKEYSRERVLGGASTTWSGLSAPLDPIDMKTRPFLEVPAWPISRDVLLPYWEAAAARYRFPSLSAFQEFESLRTKSDIQPHWEEIHEKIFLAPSEPQNFGKEWESPLRRVDVLYRATVTELRGSPGHIEYAMVMSNKRQHYRIRAKMFVLAAGGIENSRLLLASNLGNEHDQVGRYFMNHPKNTYGIIQLRKPLRDSAYFFGCLRAGYAGYAGLQLSEDIQNGRGVLNAYVRLEPVFPWSGNRGVEAAIYLFKRMKIFLRAWKRGWAGETVPLRAYAETGDDDELQDGPKHWGDWMKLVAAVVLHMSAVARYAYARLIAKKSPAIKTIRVRNFMEMEPHYENRVLLSGERDMYGQLVPLVRHAPTELDRRSLLELHRVLGEEIRAQGIGEFHSDLVSASPWPVNQDSSHHLGGTRMGTDPATSVVNEQLRLHGVDNVYCAGGSVFPTSGCANPTFTMCALSIRLAEHLRGCFRGTIAGFA